MKLVNIVIFTVSLIMLNSQMAKADVFMQIDFNYLKGTLQTRTDSEPDPDASFQKVGNAELDGSFSSPLQFSAGATIGYRFRPVVLGANVEIGGEWTNVDTQAETSSSYLVGSSYETFEASDHISSSIFYLNYLLRGGYDYHIAYADSGDGSDHTGFYLYGGLLGGVQHVQKYKITYEQATSDWPSYTDGTPKPDYENTTLYSAESLFLPIVGAEVSLGAQLTRRHRIEIGTDIRSIFSMNNHDPSIFLFSEDEYDQESHSLQVDFNRTMMPVGGLFLRYIFTL